MKNVLFAVLLLISFPNGNKKLENLKRMLYIIPER